MLARGNIGGSRSRRTTQAGYDGASGVMDDPPQGTTRRNNKMRKELITANLGKRVSIGTRSHAKSLAPMTPRRALGTARRGSGSFGSAGGHDEFSHAEVDEEEYKQDYRAADNYRQNDGYDS